MPPTCVVTGANRGIGLELARQLAARGETVVGTARDPESAADLQGLGERVRVEELDLASPKSVAAFARRLKGAPVDRLVHNAAIGEAGPAAAEVGPEELETYFRVNAIGPFLLTQALLPNLRAGERKARRRDLERPRLDRPEHERRLGRLPGLEDRPPPARQDPRRRARRRRPDLRRPVAGLGAHPHGRPGRPALAGAERRGHAEGHGPPRPEGLRPLLQRARPPDPLVGGGLILLRPVSQRLPLNYDTSTAALRRISGRGVMPRPGAVDAAMRPFRRCGAPVAVETVT